MTLELLTSDDIWTLAQLILTKIEIGDFSSVNSIFLLMIPFGNYASSKYWFAYSYYIFMKFLYFKAINNTQQALDTGRTLLELTDNRQDEATLSDEERRIVQFIRRQIMDLRKPSRNLNRHQRRAIASKKRGG